MSEDVRNHTYAEIAAKPDDELVKFGKLGAFIILNHCQQCDSCAKMINKVVAHSRELVKESNVNRV
jgi:hypothetical protein